MKGVLLQWFINFLIRKLLMVLLKMKIWQTKIAQELHKPIVRKFEKREVYSPFIDSI